MRANTERPQPRAHELLRCLSAEQRDDGTLVLRPESSEEVIEQFADRRLSEGEFLESLDRLHAAKLREEDRR